MDFKKIFKKKSLLFFLIGGAILILMAFFCFAKYPQNRTAFGVKIDNINVGLKTKKEAEEILKNKINEISEKEIVFELKKDTTFIAQKQIKVSYLSPKYNIKGDIEKAFKIGKRGNFLLNFKEKILALFGKRKINLTIDIPIEKIDVFLKENFGRFETPPVSAKVYFSEADSEFKIKEAKEGKMFQRDEIKKYIEENLKNLKTPKLCLSLKEDKECFYIKNTSPEIKNEIAIEAKNEANEILRNGPYYLKTENNSFLIKNNVLGNWFLFVPKENNTLSITLDEASIKDYLQNLSYYINIEPQNAILAFEGGKIKIISPSKEGKILNINESTKIIKEKILNKESKINLLIEIKKPQLTEEKIKNLKIEKLIGRGTSNFYGSPKNRIHNIKVAASKFNGILIAPGEIFSFNKALGEVSAKEGYLPELVIKENKTVPEYGGGICQVSTTMFRAAVYSGLEIIERHAHAFPISYYNPQGFDATVYQPSPDLKFKNNTGEYILVQTKIYGYNLIFEFYGKDDGRKVIVKGPYQYDIKKDGSMKAKLTEEVWKDNKLVYSQTFYSFYESPAKYPVNR